MNRQAERVAVNPARTVRLAKRLLREACGAETDDPTAGEPHDDEAEAVELAHACEQLRGASLWTRDGARQWRLAHGLRCERISINGADDAGTATAAGQAPSLATWGMDLRERYTRIKSMRIQHD